MPASKMNPKISVVIPARNEALNLPHVLPHIPSMVNEVILVDGHSSDNTAAVAQQLLPGIRIITQQGRGKGDALRSGFAASSGDIIVALDADGSTDPQEIPLFVEALLAGSDFAKGSRFAPGGGSVDNTFIRWLGNYGLSKLASLLFRTRFSDVLYGYNAFWKYCLDHVEVDLDGFEGETLLSIRAHKIGLKVVEVASFEHRRIHGESKLYAFKDGWLELKAFLRERYRKGPSSALVPQLRSTFIVQQHLAEKSLLVTTSALADEQ